MPSNVALLVYAAIVVALLWTSGRGNTATTFASWIVLVWISVGASRPISTWFQTSSDVGNAAESYDSGNPVERNFYLFLLAAGIFVLAKRRFDFRGFLRENRALFAFTLFWALSAVWADYTFITFKRWVRDSGTIVMVLVLLTEPDPIAAFRKVFVRSGYILIPFSLMLIRHFSELGRVYSRWDGELMYVGVTTHKNTLGMLALVSVLFITWDVLETYQLGRPRKYGSLLTAQVPVLAVSIYLLYLSHSATSQVCTLLGLAILCGLQTPQLRNNIGRVKVWAITGLIFFSVLNSIFDVKAEFLKLVGRDPTLTTRTEVWPILLKYQTNPVLGQGFKSFWAGKRLTVLWDDYGIIQAHNGYLETYLSGGLAGVALLLAFLFSGLRRINRALNLATNYSFFCIAIWLLVVIHNFTEASYNTFSPLWISLLVVSTSAPLSQLAGRRAREESRGDPVGIANQALG